MMIKKITLALVFAVCAAASEGVEVAGAQPHYIPMERSAWEKHNPLGGEFENGSYVVLHEQAPAFEMAKDFPASSNLVVEALFTPERDIPGEGNSAIAILESPGRYWHLFLSKNGRGVRRFGLNELGGYTQLQASLKREIDEGGDASWEWGRTYRLRITLGGGAVEGEVFDDETGTRLFHRRYALAPGHIASGRPAFKLNRVLGEFDKLRVGPPCGSLAQAGRPANTDRPACEGEREAPHSQTSAPHAQLFYRTMRDGAGKWWFVDPDGKPMFLSGIGVVNHNGHYSAALGYAPYARTVARKYPTLEDWATNTLARIRAWGFNFLSSPSANLLHRGLPTAHVVNMGQNFSLYGDEFDLLPCDGGPCTGFPNVFHPLWPEWCRYRAMQVCSHDRDDPEIVGWYIDNELSWWGDKRQFKTPPESGLYAAAARKAQGHPARVALERFLAERGFAPVGPQATQGAPSASTAAPTESKASESRKSEFDFSAVPVSVKREFVRLCARLYFEATTAAIREADPNHLVLGCRFAGLPSADPVVWEECGRHCDAVSVNIYPMADLDRGVAVDWPGPNARLISDIIGERARMAGKPVIVTEWCFSALDSGLPCTHGAGQRFFTQKERAEATSIFARTMWAMPEVAGYVYFMWCDQPAVGKNGPQSENTNYGIVNADDEPYEEQVAALAAPQLHPTEARAADVPQPRKVEPPKAEDFAREAGVLRVGRCSAALPRASRTAHRAQEAAHDTGGEILRLDNGKLQIGCVGAFSAMLREYSAGHVDWTAATTASAEAAPGSATPAAQQPPKSAPGSGKASESCKSESPARPASDGASCLRGGAAEPPHAQNISFRGRAASGPFEVTMRFYEPADTGFFLAELLSVKNCGDKPLPFDSVFFRMLPINQEGADAARGDDVFEPPKAGQPTPIPPMLWRPWRSGAWILPDSTVLGLLSPRQTGVQIRFWRDSNFHSDAEMRYPKRTLAPGETWAPNSNPFVIGAALAGGEPAWRDFCASIRAGFSAP